MIEAPKGQSKIKVIIADDQPLFRNGIVTTLKNLNFVNHISQAANGQEVLNLLESEAHDLVIMDIQMPVMNGIQTSATITKHYPKTKIIALSVYDDQENISCMIKNGAMGYLLKNANKTILVEAIKTVMAGRTYYSTEVTGLLTDRLIKGVSSSGEKEFDIKNPLIRDIIFLLCHELTNPEIAVLVGKSLRAIEYHRNKIIKMTHSKNIIGVVLYAIALGILEDPKLKKKWMNQIN